MTKGREWMWGGAVALAVMAASCGEAPAGGETEVASDAVAAAADGRPGGVPDGYVATPHGWRHRSCVIAIGADETLGEHHLRRRDGTRRGFDRCQYPAFDKQGAALGAPTHQPTANGWIASATATSQGAITWMSAEWVVPATPPEAAGQTLYLFPGVEPGATGDVILQPVLAWNGFGDHAYTLASWACCKDGNVFNSAPIGVAPGHRVNGMLAGASCADGVCASWTITSKDVRTGVATAFTTTGDGEQMSWVFAGALEVYAVDNCRQYPGGSSVTFSNIQVRDSAGVAVLPAWSGWSSASSVSPNCNPQFQSLQVSPNGTTSSWTLTWQRL